MRSKIAALFIGTTFLVAAASIAAAAPTEQHLSGKVSRIDSAAKTLVVMSNQGGKKATDMTFTLAPDAKIMQGPDSRSLGELKVGEGVKVTYADQGSTHQAKRIELVAVPAKQAQAPVPHATTPKPKAAY